MNKEAKKEILSVTYPLKSRPFSRRVGQKAMLALTLKESSISA